MKWKDLGLGLVATLVIWQLLAWAIRRPVMPSPWSVFAAMPSALENGLLWHLVVSGARVLLAISFSVLFAVPAGLGLGQIRSLDRLFSPLVYIAYPVPKIVLLPVILVLFGAGDFSRVFLIAAILFFQVLVVVRDEASRLRPELILSVRSLGAGRRALFRFVYLPASVPAVLTALRLSVGTAVAVLFIAESFATNSGLGYYIMVETWGRLDYREMYTGVLAMSLLGLTLYFLIEALDRRLCPWRHE